MSQKQVRSKRVLIVIFVLLLSSALVGVVFVAAQSVDPSAAEAQSIPPQAQFQTPRSQAARHFPIPPVSQPVRSYKPDASSDQMRQQAMAASRSANNSQVGLHPDLQSNIYRLEFWNTTSNLTWIWGNAEPNTQITVTTSSGDVLYGMSDDLGDFGTDHGTYLYGGDIVTATATGGLEPVVVMFPAMQADSNSTTEQVFGHISLPNWEVEIYPNNWAPMTTTLTDAGGNFAVTFQDIPRNGRGYIRFVDFVQPDGLETIFHRQFDDQYPSLRVNYAHDWIEGNYNPGWQVAITVTNEAGEVKATAQGETGEIPGWGGDTGFSTNNNVFWDSPRPDIQPFDFVYVRLEKDGEVYSSDVQVGEIDGSLYLDADLFQGTLNIPWLTDPVYVDCGAWIENGPGVPAGEVDPNGGSFTCDFGSIGFDLQAGMDVGVSYYDPEGNQVINVFREPAPDLRINMWGQGIPASGNNYILEFHYNNDGWLTAPGVTIQSELWGMEYLSDTSGFSHTGSGNPGDPIIWDLGDLPYNHFNEEVFYVFVKVVNPPGGGVFANASISSSMEYYQDPNRLYTDWESEISGSSESDLSINKWAWTGDPAPGELFVYAINVCNNSSDSSSEVTITDTLPISTTFIDWWAWNPGWELVTSSTNEVVVTRPTISGNGCNEVYINVQLSDQAWQGMEIINHAQIWAASDPNPNDNQVTNYAYVGWPSYNLHMSTNWVYGQFTPGGEVGYEFGFQNWGNKPMPGTQLVTTLPTGTEFLYAYTWDWSGWVPITPTAIVDGQLLWDFGVFPNGYNQNLGIRLRINDDVLPGTVLTLENKISGGMLEQRYDDNTLVYTQVVNDFGPNLRIDKHSNWWWNDWYDGDIHYQQIWYELRIMNVGSVRLENPVVVDTYPISTTVSGCWWNHGAFTGCEVDQTNHQVIYYLEKLDSGETASAVFVADVDPQYAGVQGLAYTNQAEISDFDDIVPGDNLDEVTAFTGPDTFVRKWLKEGELRAGNVITYTVEFGNLNRWPWNTNENFGSHITETLPEGMTFIKALGYWDYANDWEPESINGQQVVWGWGPMWADATWTFDLVVKIDESVVPGTELLNTIEAWGDSPDDIDVNPLNNHFEYSLFTLLYRNLMPFILKTP